MNNNLKQKLTDFLQANNSKNINEDMKMFETVLSDKYVKRLERFIMNITKKHNIVLNVKPFNGSYSLYNKRIVICVDPIMAYSSEDTLDTLWLKILGIAAHESGHICYSDFNVVAENFKKEFAFKSLIPMIGAKLYSILQNEEMSDASKVDNPYVNKEMTEKEAVDELTNVIYQYIYYHQLKDVLNSLEDGAIEHHTPAYYTHNNCYAGIVSMRNNTVKKEQEYLRRELLQYGKQDKDDMPLYITEIRHYATIGYKENLNPLFLSKLFDKDEITEIEQLSLYARLCTKNSLERNAISKILLDKFNPILEKKAEKFASTYIKEMLSSPEDALNNMENEMNIHKEMICQGQMDSSLAGKTNPQNVTSDYSLDLPKQTMDKIENKLKEEQKKSDNDNGESSNSNQQDSSSDNASNEQTASQQENSNSQQDSQQDNAHSDNKDSQNESSKKDENADNQSSSDTNNGEQQSGSEDEQGNNEENSDNNGESETGFENEESDENKKEVNDSKDSGYLSDKNKDGETRNSVGKKLNKNDERLKDENAVRESLNKLQKDLKKEEITELKNSLQSNKSGKAPVLENNLANPDSISDVHKGIQVNYHPSKTLHKTSDEGEEVQANEKELVSIATSFSKKLKEVLMYQAKTRRKKGLKNGNLDTNNLSRIITDQKVFKKTINGVEKKARLAVLLDLSGSMYGEKVKDAIAAAYILAEACRKINVPISIMGHNTSYNSVELYHFVEYENYLKSETKEKLFTADAGGANHDGLAIFHSATDLIRHSKKNEQLVLLVISDGAPAGLHHYWGEFADNDIKNIYTKFEKEFKVKTIGIGIGDDVDHVPNIYKNYLLVPNVEKLGNELLKVLKSLLLK